MTIVIRIQRGRRIVAHSFHITLPRWLSPLADAAKRLRVSETTGPHIDGSKSMRNGTQHLAVPAAREGTSAIDVLSRCGGVGVGQVPAGLVS
jgi:hypothetical protein